jgi:putative cell wall-binding protein
MLRKRLLLALALSLSLLPVSSPQTIQAQPLQPAATQTQQPQPVAIQAQAAYPLVELAGADRYETAVRIAQAAYPSGAAGVIVANGERFPDALTASALAGLKDYPILLTTAATLPDSTQAAIQALGAQEIIVVGAQSAAGAEVESQLQALLPVDGQLIRYGGLDRYETAAQIRDAIMASGDWPGTFIIASGRDFADSASIAPYAFKNAAPILLAEPSGALTAEAVAFLTAMTAETDEQVDAATASGPPSIIITGGSAAVSAADEQLCRDLGYQVTRLGGEDRYDTSLKIAQWSVANAGMSYEPLAITSGLSFPDALCGSVLQGRDNSVLQLVSDRPEAIAKLRALASAAHTALGKAPNARVLGGSAAVSVRVRAELQYYPLPANDAPEQTPLRAQMASAVTAYLAPSVSAPAVTSFAKGSPDLLGIPWDAAGQWYKSSYRGQAVYVQASQLGSSSGFIVQSIRPSLSHGPKYADSQKYIVLHDTEGSGAPMNVINWWDGNGSYVAAHFVVGRDGSVAQCVPLDQIAHHAGFGNIGNNDYYGVSDESRDDRRGTVPIGSWCPDYGMNSYSIGIEMVHYSGQADYTAAQLQTVDLLIAYIDAYYGQPSDIIDHKAWRAGNSDTSAQFSGYLANYQRYRTYDGR